MPDHNDPLTMRVVYQLPGMDQIVVRKDALYKSVEGDALKMDVYYPQDVQPASPQVPRAAVLLVHGGATAEQVEHIKDTVLYESWGRLLAAAGFVAVMFKHRSYGGYTTLREAGSDVDDLVTYVRVHGAELGVDGDALCLFAFSGGSLVGLRTALRGTPAYVRCSVAYYAGMTIMNPKYFHFSTDEEELVREFSPVYHLAHENAERIAPIFVARAGRDRPFLNESIDEFVGIACQRNIPITLMNHPSGEHCFEVLNDDARTREIIGCTLAFLAEHLHAPA